MWRRTLFKNQCIPLVIESISSDGNGVGHFEGQAVFVPFSAVGDVLRVKAVKVCKNYAFGIIEEIVSPGAGRIQSDCPIFGKCGGCALRHLTYEAELEAKQGFVEDAMRRIGGLRLPVQPILPAPHADRYRNKVQYPLFRAPDGSVRAGFYASRSHRPVPCADCHLQPVLLNQIARTVCALLTKYHIPVYDEQTHSGLVRHVYLRHAVTTDRVMVCLVCNGQRLPHAGVVCDALRKAHPEIETIVLNVNTRRTNVITGEKNIALYGSGVLCDAVSGVPVALGPLSFYQVNTKGAEQLYAVAAQFAALEKEDTLLDLYCGAGTIGLSMMKQTNCARLVGVEIVPEAVESARRSAEEMGVENAEFLCADAGEAAQKLAAQGLSPDVIVLDPPRKGCDAATIDAVCTMAPRRVVMVSCNPATAARDAAALEGKGYEAKRIQPVDMFPRTRHVETVVCLSQQKPDDVIRVGLDLDELEVTPAESRATYGEIKAYVWEKFGLKVSSLYISQVKRKCGLDVGENYNLPKSENAKQPQCPPEKENAIVEALKHFQMIEEAQ